MQDTGISELLRKREALLRKLLSVTREHPMMPSVEGYAESIMENLALRQELLDEINALGIGGVPPNEAEKEVLSEIKRHDDKNLQLTCDCMNALREKLQKNREGLTSLRGYDSRGEVEPVYFDKQN